MNNITISGISIRYEDGIIRPSTLRKSSAQHIRLPYGGGKAIIYSYYATADTGEELTFDYLDADKYIVSRPYINFSRLSLKDKKGLKSLSVDCYDDVGVLRRSLFVEGKFPTRTREQEEKTKEKIREILKKEVEEKKLAVII